MNNIKIVAANDLLQTVKVIESNLWMEPSTKRVDAQFWVERFEAKNIPYIVAQYDTELTNEKNEKLYRRVYGVFIDMKTWERKNDSAATQK